MPFALHIGSPYIIRHLQWELETVKVKNPPSQSSFPQHEELMANGIYVRGMVIELAKFEFPELPFVLIN